MNENIPRVAYVEAQVLHCAGRKGLLAPCVRAVESEHGLEPGYLGTGIFFETRVLSLLYCLIVVPKEFWSLGPAHAVYGQIADQWSVGEAAIRVDRSRWRDPTYRFIHHLRNAVAHANLEFRERAFEFWDKNGGEEKYRAVLSETAMQQFLAVVGSLMSSPGVRVRGCGVRGS